MPNPSPGTPRHPAYPSGHSTYAGAASELLSWFFPDYREEFNRLADNAGMARMWAGIHYRSDHIQGRRLGRTVACLVIRQLEQMFIPRTPDECELPCANAALPRSADPCQAPPSDNALADAAAARQTCCAKGPQPGPAPVSPRGSSPEQSRSPQKGAR
jgi:hypothetical protein